MIHPDNNPASLTVQHMSTDLRIQLQSLQAQVEAMLESEQCQSNSCLAQKLIALVSATNHSQTLSLELVHRLSQEDSKHTGCPKGCEVHCPWFHANQRVERWFKESDFEVEAYRLALYDFQRGVMMALSLADYFEAHLSKKGEDDLVGSALLQSAFCISSWLRKLVQLLTQVAPKAACPNDVREKKCG